MSDDQPQSHRADIPTLSSMHTEKKTILEFQITFLSQKQDCQRTQEVENHIKLVKPRF